MPYNMKNSEQVLLKILDKVIGEELVKISKEGHILIATQSIESNMNALKNVLKKLRDANFKIDVKESCFCVEKVSFFGFEISKDGFKPDADTVEKIR